MSGTVSSSFPDPHMSPFAICRVDVIVDAGHFSAELFADDRVSLYRWRSGAWQELGRGRLDNGEIIGVHGGAVIDDRVYAAIEGAFDAFMRNPVL